MIAARCTIAAGDTSGTSASTAARSVRSAHRTSTPSSLDAALRLAGTSRSVATTWRPSASSRRTVAEPTRPNAPVTSTAPDMSLPGTRTCSNLGRKCIPRPVSSKNAYLVALSWSGEWASRGAERLAGTSDDHVGSAAQQLRTDPHHPPPECLQFCGAVDVPRPLPWVDPMLCAVEFDAYLPIVPAHIDAR